MDGTGKIRLADTKSFVFTDKNGDFSYTVPGNEDVTILRTREFIPSEIDRAGNLHFKAEYLHSSLLGRNIYTYLTGYPPSDKKLKNLEHESFFQSTLGKQYKLLIEALIIDPPKARMSLEEAQDKLLELGVQLDPNYKLTFEKTTNLVSLLGVKSERVHSLVKADRLDGIPWEKIKNSLNKLELVSIKCNQRMKRVDEDDFKIGGERIFPQEMLQAAKADAMRGAGSIDGLKDGLNGKLTAFETKLNQDVIGKMSEYRQLKQDLDKNLRFGKKDKQMDAYLAECDKEVMKGTTLSLDNKLFITNNLIKTMNENIGFLRSKENTAVRDIITKKIDTSNKWYTLITNKKARGIENAMASVPIEERIKLLTSEHPKVTGVLKAMHKKSLTSPSEEGKIKVDSSSDAFQRLKAKFIDAMKMNKREDVKQKENKGTGPKI